MTETTEQPQRTLAGELGFTADDLAANRTGQLSEMQHWRLRARRRRSTAVIALVLVIGVLLATFLLFFGTREGGSGILALVGVGVTICNAALVGVFARYWFRLSGDIRAREVLINSGELERVVKPVTRRVINYIIRVDEAEVFVSKEAFELFEHEAPYTLYRTPYTGALLAAEPGEHG